MAIGGGTGTDGKYYRLEADLTGAESITQPLGNNSDKAFMGHFDGGGHTINLNITGNYENSGLFATVGPSLATWGAGNGSVKNLKLTGTVNVSGSNVKYAGSVACSISDDVNSNVTFISGIANSVTVTASGPMALGVGGIAGLASSDYIENCYSTGNVSIVNTGGEGVSAGGIIGSSVSPIRYCWASGAVTASNKTSAVGNSNSSSGGIYGSGEAGEISHCAALNPAVSGDNSLFEFFVSGAFRVGADFMTTGGNLTFTNNYANSAMTVNGAVPTDYKAHNDRNGADVTLSATEAADGDWWKTTAGWSSRFGTSETAPWKWDSASKRPVLWFE